MPALPGQPVVCSADLSVQDAKTAEIIGGTPDSGNTTPHYRGVNSAFFETNFTNAALKKISNGSNVIDVGFLTFFCFF